MALIRYNGKNILYYNFKLAIMPGVNELKVGVLERMLKHSGFKHRFESGVLQVIEDDPKNEPHSKELNRKGNNKFYDEMLKLIPEMFDKKLLERIIKTENRAPIVEAAKSQLYKISIKAEDEEKSKDKKEFKKKK